jgi:hypothetical protein
MTTMKFDHCARVGSNAYRRAGREEISPCQIPCSGGAGGSPNSDTDLGKCLIAIQLSLPRTRSGNIVDEGHRGSVSLPKTSSALD